MRDLDRFDREVDAFKKMIAQDIQRRTNGGIDDPVALVTALGLLCAEFGMLAGVEKPLLTSALVKTVDAVYANSVVVVENARAN